jgi:hypothetical protein
MIWDLGFEGLGVRVQGLPARDFPPIGDKGVAGLVQIDEVEVHHQIDNEQNVHLAPQGTQHAHVHHYDWSIDIWREPTMNLTDQSGSELKSFKAI